MNLNERKKDLLKVLEKKEGVSGILYGLIVSNKLDNIICNIDDKKTKCPKSSFCEKGYLTGSEQFIDILENFIGFYERELSPLISKSFNLELALENVETKFLLSKKYRGDGNNTDYFIFNFKKLLVENMYKNINAIRYCEEFSVFFDSVGIVENMDINDAIDVNRLFLFLKEMIWSNHNEIMSPTFLLENYKNYIKNNSINNVNDDEIMDKVISNYCMHFSILINNYEKNIIYIKNLLNYSSDRCCDKTKVISFYDLLSLIRSNINPEIIYLCKRKKDIKYKFVPNKGYVLFDEKLIKKDNATYYLNEAISEIESFYGYIKIKND